MHRQGEGVKGAPTGGGVKGAPSASIDASYEMMELPTLNKSYLYLCYDSVRIC